LNSGGPDSSPSDVCNLSTNRRTDSALYPAEPTTAAQRASGIFFEHPFKQRVAMESGSEGYSDINVMKIPRAVCIVYLRVRVTFTLTLPSGTLNQFHRIYKATVLISTTTLSLSPPRQRTHRR